MILQCAYIFVSTAFYTLKYNRVTQREYSSKPFKHSIVKCIFRI